jgi:hypothetical protein
MYEHSHEEKYDEQEADRLATADGAGKHDGDSVLVLATGVDRGEKDHPEPNLAMGGTVILAENGTSDSKINV